MDKKIEDLVDKKVDSRLEAFMALFRKHLPVSENTLVLLLKGHLLIEYILNHLIILEKEGSAKLVEELGFAEKLEIVEKEKILEGQKILPIKRLNKIRNKLSHELEYQITEADVDYLGFCLGKDYIHRKTRLLEDHSGDNLLRYLLVWVLAKLIIETYGIVLRKTIFEDIKKELKT